MIDDMAKPAAVGSATGSTTAGLVGVAGVTRTTLPVLVFCNAGTMKAELRRKPSLVMRAVSSSARSRMSSCARLPVRRSAGACPAPRCWVIAQFTAFCVCEPICPSTDTAASCALPTMRPKATMTFWRAMMEG